MTAGGAVASPCTLVCTIDLKTGWCLGCYRTLDEIARWGAMSNDERRMVLAKVRDRAAG